MSARQDQRYEAMVGLLREAITRIRTLERELIPRVRCIEQDVDSIDRALRPYGDGYKPSAPSRRRR